MFSFICSICQAIHHSENYNIPFSMRAVSIIKGKMIETSYQCLSHSDVKHNCINNTKCQCGQTWDCQVFIGTEYEKLNNQNKTIIDSNEIIENFNI